MNDSDRKLIEYLAEAQAAEIGMTRTLQSQILLAPRGAYRRTLESHLTQTHDHAARLRDRMRALGRGADPVQLIVGLAESAVSQVLALGKVPLELVRGSGGEEKVLKDAKDACSAEALEIATYTALEQMARTLGDDQTARLAVSIRQEEEKALQRLLREIPRLTDAVVEAQVEGNPSYDLSETGAADRVRDLADGAKETASAAQARGRRAARTARRVPGVARAEGEVKGAFASEADLPISGYADLNAEEIIKRLPGLSQVDLAKIDAYERREENRTTILSRIAALRSQEPWPGYDELTVAEVRERLGAGDDDRARAVRSYERAHKNRAGVLDAAERETANA
jgi:ferritin-like metal-binding protein YciE